MAVSRRLPVPAVLVRRPLAGEVLVPWRRNEKVRLVGEQIRKLERDRARRNCEAIVAIGRRLIAAHQQLPHGDWEPWVEATLPFTPRRARDFVALTVWAEERPDHFERFKHLDVTKVERLAMLSESAVRLFATRKLHAIPGTDKKVGLEEMSVRELDLLIGGLAPNPGDPPPIATFVQRSKHYAASLDAIVDVLVSRGPEVSRTEARALHDTLLETAARLRSGLSL